MVSIKSEDKNMNELLDCIFESDMICVASIPTIDVAPSVTAIKICEEIHKKALQATLVSTPFLLPNVVSFLLSAKSKQKPSAPACTSRFHTFSVSTAFLFKPIK